MSRLGGAQSFDVVVIGGGLYGIQAARTYLEIHPDASLRVFEASSCVGGVWSKERMYDAFWTQTPLGIGEFSDRSITSVPWSETEYGFFAARHLSEYLEEYVEHHSYDGKTLASRIDLRTAVTLVRKASSGMWEMRVKGRDMPVFAKKIIDACGMTSKPNIPSIKGSDAFPGLMIHHRDFGSSNIVTSEKCQRIVVLGGAKSAADVAYACAKAGKTVHWIIRRSGSGPCAFVPAKDSPLYNNSNESIYNRFAAQLLASIFTKPSWLQYLLHQTAIGRRLFSRFWASNYAGVLDQANYDRPDGKANGYYNLKPDTPIFWQNDSTSVNQRKDFFDVVARKIKVYREDVQEINASAIVLANGQELEADAVVFATGWSSENDIYDQELCYELGLPVRRDYFEKLDLDEWAGFDRDTETQVQKSFPILQSPPPYYKPGKSMTPFRLYRGIVPFKDPLTSSTTTQRSIAFVGRIMLGNNFRAAEAQSLWAVAALDGTLDLTNHDRMKRDISAVATWSRRRYLAKGQLGNYCYYDLVPYTDQLLEDMRLSSHLPRWPWQRLFRPTVAAELRNLINEYKQNDGPEKTKQQKIGYPLQS